MASDDAGGLSVWCGLVAVLVASASASGLLIDGVYRDNLLVTASWHGTDLVSLLVAVPLLIVTGVRVRTGGDRAVLVGLGLLACAAYNYAFYLFGAAFNRLFLLYVAILVASSLGLIFGFTSTAVRRIVRHVRPGSRDRRVGWLVSMIAFALGAFWVATSIAYVRTGRVPAMVTATGHPTNVTGALDLWLVVTFGLLGGFWLVRGRPWGFVVASVWAVKGAVYMVALVAAGVSAFRAGTVDGLAELGLWGGIGVACLLAAAVLLRAGGPLSPRSGVLPLRQSH